MVYVVSDIHGCFNTFKTLLNKVNFNEESDKLFILGDIVDRGPHIWEIYEWVRERHLKNVYMIIGNHEYDFITDVYVAKGKQIVQNNIPITKENKHYVEALKKHKFVIDHYHTIKRLTEKPNSKTIDDLVEMAEFFAELPFYYEIKINGNEFVLVHAGCKQNFEETSVNDFIWDRTLAETDTMLKNMSVIFGHTPTPVFGMETANRQIDERINAMKINIDCGCVYGYNLCMLRLNDMEFFYQKNID